VREPADDPIAHTDRFFRQVVQDPYIVRRSRDGVAAIDCRMTPVRVDAMLVLVDVRERVRSEVMT
jgi:hypothetical protein